MKICFEVITNAELLRLQSEASEVPFIYQGQPLIFRMAGQRILGIEFGNHAQAAEPPGQLTLVGTFTPFRLKVWQTLLTIPRGTTWTYTQLASRIGNPRAVRAVASAVAANTFAYIIPCHRIVPASGGTGKYRWGAKQKALLLKTESETP